MLYIASVYAHIQNHLLGNNYFRISQIEHLLLKLRYASFCSRQLWYLRRIFDVISNFFGLGPRSPIVFTHETPWQAIAYSLIMLYLTSVYAHIQINYLNTIIFIKQIIHWLLKLMRTSFCSRQLWYWRKKFDVTSD